jgi:hypothetical protein
MTKAEIIYLILTNLNGSDSESDNKKQYHPADVEQYVSVAYQQVIADSYKQSRDKEAMLGDVRRVRTVDKVTTDASGSYFKIPSGLVSIARSPRILSVYVQGRRGDDFLSEEPEQTAMFDDLEISITGGFGHPASDSPQRTMNVQGDRVYLNGYVEGQVLLYECIPGAKALTDEDEMTIPNDGAVAFIEMVKQMIRSEGKPKEQINDTANQ